MKTVEKWEKFWGGGYFSRVYRGENKLWIGGVLKIGFLLMDQVQFYSSSFWGIGHVMT